MHGTDFIPYTKPVPKNKDLVHDEKEEEKKANE